MDSSTSHKPVEGSVEGIQTSDNFSGKNCEFLYNNNKRYEMVKFQVSVIFSTLHS